MLTEADSLLLHWQVSKVPSAREFASATLSGQGKGNPRSLVRWSSIVLLDTNLELERAGLAVFGPSVCNVGKVD